MKRRLSINEQIIESEYKQFLADRWDAGHPNLVINKMDNPSILEEYEMESLNDFREVAIEDAVESQNLGLDDDEFLEDRYEDVADVFDQVYSEHVDPDLGRDDV